MADGESGISAAPDDGSKWKLEIFRDKLRHSLSARFFLRFHVTLFLTLTVFLGWMADLILLKMGLRSMAIRYVASILFAYAGFIFGVYIWIEYSGIRDYIHRRQEGELVGDDVPRRPTGAIETAKPWDWLVDPLGCVVGDGCLNIFVILFALVILFFFFGGYVFADVTTFFADIVLELLLAAGVLKGLNQYEKSGWVSSVLNATFWSLMFTLTIALLFAWWAHNYYPTATTLPEVVARWRQ